MVLDGAQNQAGKPFSVVAHRLVVVILWILAGRYRSKVFLGVAESALEHSNGPHTAGTTSNHSEVSYV
jgi:hypothetical protein